MTNTIGKPVTGTAATAAATAPVTTPAAGADPVEAKEKKARKKKDPTELDKSTELIKFKLSQELQTILGHRVAQDTAWKILTATMNQIFGTLKEKEYVRLPAGLGCFFMKQTKESKRRTPQGKVVEVPAQKKIRFRPGKNIK